MNDQAESGFPLERLEITERKNSEWGAEGRRKRSWTRHDYARRGDFAPVIALPIVLRHRMLE